MYEIGKFIVYKFTVHCIVYSKLLLLTSLQVYSTSDSLQQIVHLLHFCSLFFNQSESYYTFCTVVQPISELLHFFHGLHVQEKHVATPFGIYFTVVNGA